MANVEQKIKFKRKIKKEESFQNRFWIKAFRTGNRQLKLTNKENESDHPVDDGDGDGDDEDFDAWKKTDEEK